MAVICRRKVRAGEEKNRGRVEDRLEPLRRTQSKYPPFKINVHICCKSNLSRVFSPSSGVMILSFRPTGGSPLAAISFSILVLLIFLGSISKRYHTGFDGSRIQFEGGQESGGKSSRRLTESGSDRPLLPSISGPKEAAGMAGYRMIKR